MTIKECIDIVDNIKPNQYTVKEKVGWLSFIDEIIINDVLKTHEGYDGRYDNFEGYSENKLSQTLIVPSPYDRLYTEYLKMRIDGENGEMAKYNNSAELFNSHMMEYRKYYNKTHMPLDVTRKNSRPNQKQGSLNLPDAVIENITRDLYARLSEDFAEMTSQDKIYDIVMSYVMNNAAMLKGQPGKEGEPGYSPIKGIDYFTEAEKEELVSLVIKNIKTTLNGKEDVANKVYEIDFYGSGINDINFPTTKAVYNFAWGTALDAANQVAQEIRTFDIDPIRLQIQNEAHFRGYLSTNAKIKALKATPNDFAYSAESGTKWVYDAQSGWVDTNSPVPDQLTPASESIPLVDGTASMGTENAYARGDHRHPTDTTRASVEQVNKLAEDVATALNSAGKWELVKSGEMTQDVQQMEIPLGNNYKELYVRLVVPTMNPDKATDFQKGRIWLYAQNEQKIADQGNLLFEDNGNAWAVVYKIQMIDKWCTLKRLFENNEKSSQTNYELLVNVASKVGMTSGKKLTEDYISSLRALMYPQNTRVFPAGTTYEIWGVKA